MIEFKNIENIHNILSSHNKNLLFLKINKHLKLLIESMPPDIKHKLIQEGVVCDTYRTFKGNCFRIRVFHNAIAQDLRNDSTKEAIIKHINFFNKLNPKSGTILNIYAKTKDDIIINHNKILNKYTNYMLSKKPKIFLKDLMCEDFQNLAVYEEQKILINNLKESIKKTNAKIKSLRQN